MGIERRGRVVSAQFSHLNFGWLNSGGRTNRYSMSAGSTGESESPRSVDGTQSSIEMRVETSSTSASTLGRGGGGVECLGLAGNMIED